MELRVESSEGYDMPPGCYVGVRVGDVLKQGRYEPSRCYHFPAPDRRRNAKIDVYRHIGSCFVPVDPEAKFSNEIRVASMDPNVAEMRLQVNVSAGSAETAKQREARSKQVRNQAKDYLSKHNVEEKLSEAVKALLKNQPADPTEFLCKFLTESADREQDQGRPAQQTTKGPLKSGPPVAIVPFTSYYKSHMAPRSTNDFWKNMHSQFPARAVAKAPAPSSMSAATPAASGGSSPQYSGPKFVHCPSVGTWFAKRPARSVGGAASLCGAGAASSSSTAADAIIGKLVNSWLTAAVQKSSLSDLQAALAGVDSTSLERLKKSWANI